MKARLILLFSLVPGALNAPAARAAMDCSEDSFSSIFVQMRMGGALPRVTFPFMTLGNDLTALQRLVYREKVPLLETAARLTLEMAGQFPYSENAIGIRSNLAAQRAWMLNLLRPFLESMHSPYFDCTVAPALATATAGWLAQVNPAATASPWHSTARMSLAAGALKGILQLSLRTEEADAIRKLNAQVGLILASGTANRDALRSALIAAQSQLNTLMLSPRARPLAAFLQAVLAQEIGG